MLSRLRLLLLLLFVAKVNAQEVCVTYDFEEDFYEEFAYNRLVCDGQLEWTLGFYNETGISPPNPKSHTFIAPSFVQQSCVSSFPFDLTTGGRVEVNVMMDSPTGTSQIMALVQGVAENDGNDVVIGQGILISTQDAPISTDGLYTIQVTWFASGTYFAYVSINCSL